MSASSDRATRRELRREERRVRVRPVNYVPSLRDQIKGRQASAVEVVTVRTPTGFLPRVDPVTRKAMAESQQFVMREVDGRRQLSPLARAEWVEQPLVIEVGSVSYR